jgi:urease accessory protein
VERVGVDSADAQKRRLRRETDRGTDVAVDLPRGTYLYDGAVLADDGHRIVVVAREAEEAFVVRFDPRGDPARLVDDAVRLGHALGNQHVPLDVEGVVVCAPVTTSAAILHDTIRALGLEAAEVQVARVPLARTRPLQRGSAHA